MNRFKYLFLSISIFSFMFLMTGCSSSSDDNDPVTLEENISNNIDNNVSNNNSVSNENNNSQVQQEPQNNEENTTDEVEAKKETSSVLTGKAIDGYISGANIIFGEYQTTSKSDGSWVLEIPDENFKPEAVSVVNISGGIDQATKKPFEGILSNVMEADDFQQVTKTVGTNINSLPEIADLPKVMITPMTTVVSNYFQDNQADGLSLENAKNEIAFFFAQREIV